MGRPLRPTTEGGAHGSYVGYLAHLEDEIARLTGPFDPNQLPGAHAWFAREIAAAESPERPLVWTDRPDVYLCAVEAGGCGQRHRLDYPHRAVVVDRIGLRVANQCTSPAAVAVG